MKEKSVSHSILILLSMSGGLMDTYSYLCLGGIFSNAQTGNLILLSVNISDGNYSVCLSYLYPIIAFITGIVFACMMSSLLPKKNSLHWEKGVIVIEIISLIVAFVLEPISKVIAAAVISFACGLQLEGFQNSFGIKVPTTMCIGNLRGAVHNITSFLFSYNRQQLRNAWIYLEAIMAFLVGAVVESILLKGYGEKSILCSPALLLLSLVMLSLGKVNKQDGSD